MPHFIGLPFKCNSNVLVYLPHTHFPFSIWERGATTGNVPLIFLPLFPHLPWQELTQVAGQGGPKEESVLLSGQNSVNLEQWCHPSLEPQERELRVLQLVAMLCERISEALFTDILQVCGGRLLASKAVIDGWIGHNLGALWVAWEETNRAEGPAGGSGSNRRGVPRVVQLSSFL